MASFTEDATGTMHPQIARLREQVEALMKDRVTPAVADAAGSCRAAVARGGRHGARAGRDGHVHKVREQPLLALLIAAGVGYRRSAE